MGQNFLSCDREQELLLPPSLRDWLPPDHLAWFVIDLVEELDTDAFYAASAYPVGSTLLDQAADRVIWS